MVEIEQIPRRNIAKVRLDIFDVIQIIIFLGDNRFMAPETLQNIFTTRADVFSLGMTILSTICDIELPKNGDLWLKVISSQSK